MSEQPIKHSSVPFEVQHESELQLSAPVKYIPLGSPAVRHLLPEGSFRTREDAVAGAKATQDALDMRERIETLGVDSMTGLPTRRIFDENLPKYIQRAKVDIEQGKRTKTAVLVIDINNLKWANDLEQDHSTGDRYIIKSSEGLSKARRPEDFAARIGGDEFAEIIQSVEPDVLDDGTLDYDSPMKRLIENKKSKVADTLGSANIPEEVGAGVTIGYAFIEQDDTEETVLKRADKDMYNQKPQVMAENEMLKIEADPDYIPEVYANNIRTLFERWFEDGSVNIRIIDFSYQGSRSLDRAQESVDVTEYFEQLHEKYPNLTAMIKRLTLTDKRLRDNLYTADEPKAAQDKRTKWQVEHGEELHRMLKAALHELVKSTNGKISLEEFVTG